MGQERPTFNIIEMIKEIRKFIEVKVPPWSTLAKIQRFKVIQSMYIWLFIVPIIAKTLAKVEQTASLTIFDHTFNIQLSLPFSWKVFYFSAFCFTVANLIFMWKCYKLIKDHNNFSDFQEQGKGARHLYDYSLEAGEDVDEDLNRLTNIELGTGEFEPDDGFRMPETEFEKKYKNEDRRQTYFKSQFWTLRSLSDTNRLFYRVMCSLLYLLGFILIGYVFIENFATVLKMFF